MLAARKRIALRSAGGWSGWRGSYYQGWGTPYRCVWLRHGCGRPLAPAVKTFDLLVTPSLVSDRFDRGQLHADWGHIRAIAVLARLPRFHLTV
jgi:hypothetical protein